MADLKNKLGSSKIPALQRRAGVLVPFLEAQRARGQNCITRLVYCSNWHGFLLI